MQTRDEGRGYVQQLKAEDTLKDVAAAVAVVKHSGRIATIGYCWGGALSYRAACELPLACAVVYYGNPRDTSKKPRCPVMYHFGSADKSIPLDQVERLKAAHPQGVFYVYDGAGHGFNCDMRPSYDPAAAALARGRTLEFLARRLTGENRARRGAGPGERVTLQLKDRTLLRQQAYIDGDLDGCRRRRHPRGPQPGDRRAAGHRSRHGGGRDPARDRGGAEGVARSGPQRRQRSALRCCGAGMT